MDLATTLKKYSQACRDPLGLAGLLRLALGLILIFVCSSCLPEKVARVEFKGDGVLIQSGKDRLTARLVGGERSGAFLLVGGSGRGIFPFTAHFSAIPIPVVNQLIREHGDFLKCKSSGALEAQGSASSMFLYAQDTEVAKKLRAVDGLVMSWKYPVVEMTFVEIEVTAHTTDFFGRQIDVNSSAYRPNYIVKKVTLLKQNFVE